jgi:anti-sigma regulatory factor (Ser/Thr protein kinase)
MQARGGAGRSGVRVSQPGAVRNQATMNAPFRHEALMYEGLDGFVERVGAFIADGVAAGEPAFVVVGAEKIERLREFLDGTPDGVRFADMADVGRNPARIIPAWREFVDAHAATSRPFRGVGEPIWAARTADELVECQRHESLLNVAFADTGSFWLVCPYDTTALPDAVLDEAKRSHEYVWSGGDEALSATYSGVESFSQPFGVPLADPPPTALSLSVTLETLTEVREAVERFARGHGFDEARAFDVVFVANEIATNSVRHGGGRGVFRIWTDADGVVFETSDTGRILEPLVGRRSPPPDADGGLGLWIANQLSDLVQIRTFESGSVVRVHMSRRRVPG